MEWEPGTAVRAHTSSEYIEYLIRGNRLRRLKRMLYAVEPMGSGRWYSTSDPYVIAAEAGKGGVLGYCTALELLGVVEPAGLPLVSLISRPSREFAIGGQRHIQYLTPKALRDSGEEEFGVVRVVRNGTWIPCTGLERTVVDILLRSDRAGGLGRAITALVAVAHCVGAYSGTGQGPACQPRPTDQTTPCINPTETASGINPTETAPSINPADATSSINTTETNYGATSAGGAAGSPETPGTQAGSGGALCLRDGMVRTCLWGPWRFEPEVLFRYLELLGVQRAWALAGFYLTRFQGQLGIPPDILNRMAERRTGSRQYWVRGGHGGILDKRWNMIIPSEVMRAFKGRVGLVSVNNLHPLREGRRYKPSEGGSEERGSGGRSAGEGGSGEEHGAEAGSGEEHGAEAGSGEEHGAEAGSGNEHGAEADGGLQDSRDRPLS